MPDQPRAAKSAVREDFLDYPTAWTIQREGVEHFSTECSAVPPEEGGHPLGGPALLCDCGAVVEEWKLRVAMQKEARRG